MKLINIMKKKLNLWKRFWGKTYRIIETNEIKENTILIYGHRIYVNREEEKNDRRNKRND